MKRNLSNSPIPIKLFLGIDPGQTGGCALMDRNRKVVMASLWDESLLAQIAAIHSDGITIDGIVYGSITYCVLEQVHAMPGNGVSSMFKFGTNYGMWQGMLRSNGIPFSLITPQRWMKEILDSGSREPDHRFDYALRHWPTAPLFGPKGGKRKGVADGCIIADYARRTFE